ncbi:fatty acyl-AMP ligase [Planomonospora venezuelensis]|uniref:Acyl-CoA synthetase (AMP-forming)/AMP-acid ligase II n=1 Tax=Planomonospora venezuelensis TaxID=1999 RepID=A0A841D3N9_PLAVE|nr:fatty acyl-AMP ligase [Planomonospora venezuelensis]MBB5964430.1 acyl-CoA synthetase (AMP-forming)/AMP-acid ligase II [Planomonospora venezuelensis]GIN01976.1 polyketide synthase [Planomonospora venezuelensis]
MSFVQRVRAQAERCGSERSYTFVEDRRGELAESRLTFAEADRRARSTAAWLAGRRMEDQAALLLYPAGLEFLTAFLGCLYSRVIAVPSPLPQTDPRALERAEGIIKDADVRLVLTDAANRDMLAGWLREVGLDGAVECVATDALELPAPEAWAEPEIGPDTLAYMQYTSGSTSEPRGVMLTHANLLHNENEIWRAIGSPEEGVGVGWLPHYHDMGLIGMLLQPIYAGGDLYFASPISFVMRPALWLEMISRYRAGYTVAPNFAYEWCAARVTDAQLAGLDLSGLKFALNGAEPVRPSTLRTMVRRFGPAGFSERAWAPAYGMAEATLVITATPLGQGPLIRRFDAAALERHEAVPAGPAGGVELVGCGRPVTMAVDIVDPETRAPLGEGRVGEIWVRGGSVARGYWQREEATRDAFAGRTAGGEGPFLRTGDLGFVLDGELYVTGRIKDVVIVNGRNLYPQDLEEAAREAHPALGAAAAFGVQAAEPGTAGGPAAQAGRAPGPESREHVVVVQEVREQRLGGVSAAELADRIRGELARAFGLPSMSVVLVERGGVGKTTSGKIQRSRTRELLLAGLLPVVHAELTAGLAGELAGGPAAAVAADAQEGE